MQRWANVRLNQQRSTAASNVEPQLLKRLLEDRRRMEGGGALHLWVKVSLPFKSDHWSRRLALQRSTNILLSGLIPFGRCCASAAPSCCQLHPSFRAGFEICCREAGFMPTRRLQAEPVSTIHINGMEFFNGDLNNR